MIGGLGPESTIDYYRSILARHRARSPDQPYPHIIINSLDPDKVLAYSTPPASTTSRVI
jgi:aspartate racemase